MKISEFFDRLHLHDSVVHDIRYSPDEGNLTLQIELCNYDQEGYNESEPELMPGQLAFSGVKGLNADPPLTTFNWSDNVGGEFTAAGRVPARDDGGLEATEMIIYVDNYQTREHEVLVLSFLAADVVWMPTTQG